MNNNHVYVNRTLNLRKIKYIGFDMDHTLVRYHSEKFEALSHQTILNKLVENRGYPEAIKKLSFRFDLAIRGLVLDCKHGNLLKISRHGGIRISYHGTRKIEFSEQQNFYRSTYIDLGDPNFLAIDTAFSISFATLYAQLVDFKETEAGKGLPEYNILASDILNALDEGHRDGSIKNYVQKHLDQFIIKDPSVVEGLERYKKHGKKLFLLTNSDYHYTKALLDYAIQPFLKQHDSWEEIFEFIITDAMKPRFFVDNLKFLRVNPKDGTMTNYDRPLEPGIYHGGCAARFTKHLDVDGNDILYIGDHIYGDIVRLKKDCNWRTALVVEELGEEISLLQKAKPLDEGIEELMRQKVPMEEEIVHLVSQGIENDAEADPDQLKELQDKVSEIDSKIADLIRQQHSLFNKHWGQLMRTGNEETYFAHQVERFACVYMPQLPDLLKLSPRTYFRSVRRPMAHEIIDDI